MRSEQDKNGRDLMMTSKEDNCRFEKLNNISDELLIIEVKNLKL